MSFYVNGFWTGSKKKKEQVEMKGQIYENSSVVMAHNSRNDNTNTTRNLPTQNTGGDPDYTGSRCYRVTIGCLVLLCAFLVVAVTVLGSKYNSVTPDNGQTSYDNLTAEIAWLKSSYDNLYTTCDQLQTDYNNLQTINVGLKNERDRIMMVLSTLESTINNPGWNYFKYSAYYFSTSQLTWSDSRLNCREQGADLVIINSIEEQNFVEMLRSGHWVWIGLSDSAAEGQWEWVDGSPQTFGVWASGQPDGNETENCVANFRNWIDYNCAGQLPWICEKKVNFSP